MLLLCPQLAAADVHWMQVVTANAVAGITLVRSLPFARLAWVHLPQLQPLPCRLASCCVQASSTCCAQLQGLQPAYQPCLRGPVACCPACTAPGYGACDLQLSCGTVPALAPALPEPALPQFVTRPFVVGDRITLKSSGGSPVLSGVVESISPMRTVRSLSTQGSGFRGQGLEGLGFRSCAGYGGMLEPGLTPPTYDQLHAHRAPEPQHPAAAHMLLCTLCLQQPCACQRRTCGWLLRHTWPLPTSPARRSSGRTTTSRRQSQTRCSPAASLSAQQLLRWLLQGCRSGQVRAGWLAG